MRRQRLGAVLGLVAMLSACGGGGGSGASIGGGGTATPSPTPTASACSLRDRQTWAFDQLKEWYLFPETLPASLDPAPYASVDDYVDALTKTARDQRKDRFFTYMTAIDSEDAYYDRGASAGFGFRLSFDSNSRLQVLEAFEGAPALAAGIDRGAEIVSIGTSAATLQPVSAIVASQGTAGINAALGNGASVARTFRISDASGVRNVTITATSYDLAPVSTRYGVKVIDDGGRKVGYINLRSFISPADPALRNGFATLRAQGITNVIIDLRYNGGGLLSVARLMSNLLGGNRATSDVMDYVSYRPEKASRNETSYFAPQAQSIAPTRIAFIGTASSASASEFVINSFLPYLHANMALIGTNTYGKPVGQIAIDRSQCNDRFRIIAFALQNAARQGAYYDGLAGTVEASCQAADDVTFPLGDPREASVARALDFLAGRSCTRIGNGAVTSLAAPRELLTPARPTTVQREVPGAF